MTIMGKQFSGKLMEELLLKSKGMLMEGKIPSFVQAIAEHHPELLKPYADLIIRSTETQYVVALTKNKVIDVSRCLKIYGEPGFDRLSRIS